MCAVCAPAVPEVYEAVANRDLEGSIVKSGDSNFVYTASECARQCDFITGQGCNIWLWCGNVLGCISGGSNQYERDLSKYRSCWLKYDNPGQGFPRVKNPSDQQVRPHFIRGGRACILMPAQQRGSRTRQACVRGGGDETGQGA